MGDNRNFIIAIFLSVLVFVGWQYFFINPQMEAEQARQQAAAEGSGDGRPGQEEWRSGRLRPPGPGREP